MLGSAWESIEGTGMRSAMDRLGVENRFQLGLILGAAEAEAAEPGTEPPE